MVTIAKRIISNGEYILFYDSCMGVFRSESINCAFNYLLKMTTEIELPSHNRSGIIFVLLLAILDWIMFKNKKILFSVQQDKSFFTKWDILKYIVYYILVYAIFFLFRQARKFIYFQF